MWENEVHTGVSVCIQVLMGVLVGVDRLQLLGISSPETYLIGVRIAVFLDACQLPCAIQVELVKHHYIAGG